MKYTLFARQATQRLAATCFAMLIFVPAAARAAECPASSPEDPQERRRLAKEWFATAESAENAGNDAEATRAYACSYKMVAHPFTAYNLGRVAERSGDSELALKMYKAYLTLKPDAQDREEVKDKVKALEEKLAVGPAAPAEPPQAAEGTAETPPPPQEELAPPPEPKPPVVHARPPEPEPEPRSHVVEWVVGGVSVAALVGGLALNLAARSKMSACQTHADQGRDATALSECDAAKPLAYWSYGLFSAAAVGAGVDTVLLILHAGEGGSSSSRDEASLGFMPLPGGGAVTARGRF
jgi:tetratricopeptide (TPR) repeat protein